MVSVAVEAVTYEFSVDVSATSFSVFQFFQQDYAGTFAHNETITVFVERTGSAFGVFVVGGQCFHISKASYSNRGNGSFATTSEHYVSVAVLNGTESVTNAVSAGSTSSHDCSVGAFEAKSDTDLACGHVRNFHRNEERADFGGAFVTIFQGLFQESMDTADTGTNAYTATGSVDFFQIKFSVFNSQFSSSYSKLGNAVHAFTFFFVAILAKIKIFYFASDFNVKISGVKLGNHTNAGFTSSQVAPEFIFTDTDRGNRANAGYYYSSLSQNIHLKIKYLRFLL